MAGPPTPAALLPMSDVRPLSPAQLQQWLATGRRFTLVDVRQNHEVAYAALPGHTHIPLHLLPLQHNRLPDDMPLVVYCHHGVRSFQAALFLSRAGFDEVYNLQGGIDAWSQSIDPAVPRY